MGRIACSSESRFGEEARDDLTEELGLLEVRGVRAIGKDAQLS
jgi:hypothetical protein